MRATTGRCAPVTGPAMGAAARGALAMGMLATVAAAALLGGAGSAAAEEVQVTDVAGRSVTVPVPAERVILGEGRLLYGTGILDIEDPFGRLAGWAEDMVLFDPGAYRLYAEKFPEAEDLPRFGSAYAGDFSVEQAIGLDAGLVVLSLSAYWRAVENGVLDNLEAAQIPTVVIDFREDPLANTVPSMALLGRLFGEEERAQAFIDFYQAEVTAVTDVAAAIPEDERVLVIMERAAGYDPNKCCMTFGDGNLGELLEAAGGVNWGSSRFAGVGGEINPETLFAEDPAVIIGTGADWREAVPGTIAVPFGYEATAEEAQTALAALAARPGWESLSAVKSRRFHSVYHQFYTSPSHVVALQLFAKWLYPDRFAGLDPAATMRAYHERFSPIPLGGTFWATLE